MSSASTNENGGLTQKTELKSSGVDNNNKQQSTEPRRRYVPPHLRKRQIEEQEKKEQQQASFGKDLPADGKWSDIVEEQEQSNNNNNNRNDNSRGWDNERRGGGSFNNGGGRRGFDDRGPRGGNGGGGGGRNFSSGPVYEEDENGEYPDYPGRDKEYAKRGGGWNRNERNPFENLNVGESTASINFEAYEIPVETSPADESVPKPCENFSELNFGETLQNNIKSAHYGHPTPVQKYGLPIGAAGRDMMACAQTGSGKTATFLFPIIAKLVRRPPIPKDGSSGVYQRRKAYPQSLIIAPTRELATQIFEEARKFSYKTGLHAVVVYGGASIGNQLHELERGACDILVATPGRLTDIIERGRISLSKIIFLVLDEADRMLDMGFEPQIRRIVEGEDMPRTGQRQTLMFSATFPKAIQMLASCFLTDYIFLRVGRVGSTTDLVTQKFLKVNEEEKREVLCDLIQNCRDGLTLIFVETKKSADYLEHYLCSQQFPAISIHGDRTQSEREYALRSFKNGTTPFLIATNVASRGLDIRQINFVINYDMPNDIDEYVHRIGRTGRAGKAGIATSLVSPANKGIVRELIDILAETGQDIPPWLESMKSYGGMRGGSRRRGGGGGGESRFGGRDYRQNSGGGKSGGGGGRRHEGGGGGGSSGGSWDNNYGGGGGGYGGSYGGGYGGSYGGGGGSAW